MKEIWDDSIQNAKDEIHQKQNSASRENCEIRAWCNLASYNLSHFSTSQTNIKILKNLQKIGGMGVFRNNKS